MKGSQHNSGCATVASVLGISKHEINQHIQKISNEPLPLYPPLTARPLPLEKSNELEFMIDTKQEFLHRFHESPFYHQKTMVKDVRRYTDKYGLIDKEAFEPKWDLLPAELNWHRPSKGLGKSSTKKIRIDDTNILEKLNRHEELNKKKSKNVYPADIKVEKDEEEEQEPKMTNENDEDEQEFSDEEYLDGLNDYVDTYFDGGEGYGSDDNLDED